ncbi:CapA family protein [Streptomyces sp. NPDC001982]|uniref:CapA family protein n=1 Tax=Streptomyces sp. NPDC001982 TaxID=3154405 RepID=UPI003325170D
MIARRRQVALALTVLLAAGAACQAENRPERAPGRPAPTSAARGFTLVASGDVLPSASVIERAKFDAGGNGYDFRPMLAGIEPVVSRADLALCHMETAYGANGAYTGSPLFKSPPEVAAALVATGYDGCSTASEHALDDGPAGIVQTLDAMDRAGLRHAGTARTADEARTVTILQAGPARVAHLAYTDNTNAGAVPADQPAVVNPLDVQRIVADAHAARQAGADVVVVSVHWGTAWQDAPDQRQLTLAKQLTAARTGSRPDIDLVLGTHGQAPQAFEKVNGTWVVYGLGAQISGETAGGQSAQDPRGNQSTLGRFTFAPPAKAGGRWEVTRAEFVPQMYDLDAGRVVDLGAAIASGAELVPVRDRIRDIVFGRGAAKDGLVMGS